MLFARSERIGLPVGLFKSLPPLGNLAKSLVSHVSIPHQPAANHGTGLSNFVPAVEAHRLAAAHVLGADRTYHGICKPYPSATTRLVR